MKFEADYNGARRTIEHEDPEEAREELAAWLCSQGVDHRRALVIADVAVQRALDKVTL